METENSKLVRGTPGGSGRVGGSPGREHELTATATAVRPELNRVDSGLMQPSSPTHRDEVLIDSERAVSVGALGHDPSATLPAMTVREGPKTVPPGHDDDALRVAGIGCGIDGEGLPNYIKLEGDHHWVMSTDYPGEYQDLHLQVGSVMFHCLDGYTLDGEFPNVNNQVAIAQCSQHGWDYYAGSFDREHPGVLKNIDSQHPLPRIECKPSKCMPTPPAVNADVFHFAFDGEDARHGQPVRKSKKGDDQGLRNGDLVTYVAHQEYSVDGVTTAVKSVELECYLGMWFDVKLMDATPHANEAGELQTVVQYVKPPALRVHPSDSRVEQVVMLPLACQPGDQPIFAGAEGVHIKEGSLKAAQIGGTVTVVCEEGYWFDQAAKVASRTVPCALLAGAHQPDFVDEVGTSCQPASCVVDERFGDLVVAGSLTVGETSGLSTLRGAEPALLTLGFGEKITAQCVPGASMFGERAGQQQLEVTCLASGEVTPQGPCRMKTCTHELEDDVVTREHTKTHTVECPEGTVHAVQDPRFGEGDFLGRVTLEDGTTNFRTVFECDASNPDDNWHCTEGCSATDPHTRVPNCRPIMCEVPEVDNGGFVVPEGEGIPYGRHGVIHCPTGSLILEQPALDLGVCTDGGGFSAAPAGPLSCDPIVGFCAELRDLEAQGDAQTELMQWADAHSLVVVGPSTSTTRLGDTFVVKCKDGTTLSTAVDVTGQQPKQEVEVQCSEDEQHHGVYTWTYAGVPMRTLAELQCDAIVCPVPATLSNGRLTEKKKQIAIDDVVEYACPEGQVLIGAAEEHATSFFATCGPDGGLFHDFHAESKELPEWPRCVAKCGDPLDQVPRIRQVLQWTGTSDIRCLAGDSCAPYLGEHKERDGSEWGALQCTAKHTLEPRPHPLTDEDSSHLACGEDGQWYIEGKAVAGQEMDLLDRCGRHLRVTRELAELHRAGRYVQAETCLGLDRDMDRVELQPCDDLDPAQRFFFTREQLDAEFDVAAAEGQIVSSLPTSSGGHRCLSSAVQEDKPGVIKKLSPIQAAVEPCRQAGDGERRLSYSDGELSMRWSDREQHFGYMKSRGDGGNVEYDMWMLRNKQHREQTVLVRGFLYIPYAPMSIELKDLPVVANPTHHTHQYVFCYGIHCAEYDVEPPLFPRVSTSERGTEM